MLSGYIKFGVAVVMPQCIDATQVITLAPLESERL